ncbi:MAG: MotA/TolQ/ExbB proton channel family protein [Lentisphaerae bacterium]|nr:MotA/TolQ/ExbB proton channel family protein [Lentisphaerota bacterium]
MQTRSRQCLMALTVIGFLLAGMPLLTGLNPVTTAYAQAPANPPADAPASGGWDKNKKPETLMDYWRQGGPTMWPLLATAVWITAVLIELILKLRLSVVSPAGIVQQLYQTLTVKDYQKAWKIGRENPSVVTRILCAALEKLPQGREPFEAAALEAASTESNIFKNKNAYINLNSTIAPLLGLFGTISGMVGAFNSMAYSGAVGDPTKLAGDIGEALITTYAGLIVAIPGLCAYYLLGNRTKKVMEYVQSRLSVLFDEIDFDNIPEDLVIVTKEARLAYLGGVVGAPGAKSATGTTAKAATGAATKAASSAPAAASAAAAAAKAPRVACPNCSKEVTEGAAKCQHCGAELDWE